MTTRWYKPHGLAANDPQNFWRATKSAQREAHTHPERWRFLDSEMSPPAAVNPGNPMLAIVDAPATRQPSSKPAKDKTPNRTSRARNHPPAAEFAVLERFIDRPLAMHPRAATRLLDGIKRRLAGQFDDDDDDHGDNASGYQIIDNIALIRISGVLVHGRTMWWDETDYGTIGASLTQAAADPKARAIALQIESGGGEVSGLFDLADTIYEARTIKPILSIVDDFCYSAAYAIASATDYITVSRTGGVGSVGVVAMHVDVSGALDDAGLTVSLIQFGDKKTDFSPFKPLADSARARLQADVDEIGRMFDGLVSRNRNMSVAAVTGAQAATYMGQAGVDVGFADEVLSAPAAFAAIREAYGKRAMTPVSALRAAQHKPQASKPAAKPPVDVRPPVAPAEVDSEAVAKMIVAAGARARGEKPPEFISGPPPQQQRLPLTDAERAELAARIVAAGRKARGEKS